MIFSNPAGRFTDTQWQVKTTDHTTSPHNRRIINSKQFTTHKNGKMIWQYWTWKNRRRSCNHN